MVNAILATNESYRCKDVIRDVFFAKFAEKSIITIYAKKKRMIEDAR